MVGEALVCVWHLGMGEAQRRICLREADVCVRCFGVRSKEDSSVTEYRESLECPTNEPSALVLRDQGWRPGLHSLKQYFIVLITVFSNNFNSCINTM